MNHIHNVELLLTYAKLSAVTGLSVAFLKKAKMKYGLPHYKVGSLVRFRLSEVERWLNERKTNHAKF